MVDPAAAGAPALPRQAPQVLQVLVTSGPHQTLLHRLPSGADPGMALGFLAVPDRRQASMALLRFKLLDAGRLMA